MDLKEEKLCTSFAKLMEEYADVLLYVKNNEDWKNPFRDLISTTIPQEIQTVLNITEPFKIVGSYGKGRWTDVPWIAIFDTRITSSAQKGAYIVFLLNKETKELYLTFELGATEALYSQSGDNKDSSHAFVGLAGKSFNSKAAKTLQDRADSIRTLIPAPMFMSDRNINSGASGYDSGAVYYRKYTVSEMKAPDNAKSLVSDLCNMLDVYRKYYELSANSVPGSTIIDDNWTVMKKRRIDKIKEYVLSKGFIYESGLIENYYLCVKSKPFVILAGTSGTGKTRLVKLFAEAINAAYKLVPVRPDWSDSTDLFGHVDLNGRFVPGAVIDFIKAAQDDPDKPYFLCLDEMNLARVEYYLSDFLSVIETRDIKNGKIVSDPLISMTQYGPDKDAIDKYGTITFPQNLYIVGTVNMDETTFPFSKKVLDRANTIEFSYVDLIPKTVIGDVCEVQPAPNSFLRSDYLLLSQCVGEEEYIGGICAELQKINVILRSANAHVGYRVRDEIVFYMLNNKNADSLMTDNEALDHEILQKILPRIQGSSASIKDMLCKLFDVFAADHNQRSGDSDSEKMQKVLDDAGVNCKYRRSAEKLLMMVRRFEEDGFTSYWL